MCLIFKNSIIVTMYSYKLTRQYHVCTAYCNTITLLKISLLRFTGVRTIDLTSELERRFLRRKSQPFFGQKKRECFKCCIAHKFKSQQHCDYSRLIYNFKWTNAPKRDFSNVTRKHSNQTSASFCTISVNLICLPLFWFLRNIVFLFYCFT